MYCVIPVSGIAQTIALSILWDQMFSGMFILAKCVSHNSLHIWVFIIMEPAYYYRDHIAMLDLCTNINVWIGYWENGYRENQMQ